MTKMVIHNNDKKLDFCLSNAWQSQIAKSNLDLNSNLHVLLFSAGCCRGSALISPVQWRVTCQRLGMKNDTVQHWENKNDHSMLLHIHPWRCHKLHQTQGAQSSAGWSLQLHFQQFLCSWTKRLLRVVWSTNTSWLNSCSKWSQFAKPMSSKSEESSHKTCAHMFFSLALVWCESTFSVCCASLVAMLVMHNHVNKLKQGQLLWILIALVIAFPSMHNWILSHVFKGVEGVHCWTRKSSRDVTELVLNKIGDATEVN